PDQPAVMIKVPVTENQRVHPGRVDVHQPDIVGIDFRGETKVQQIAPRLTASCRFNLQRETPLAFERFALRRGGEADALHSEAGAFERLQGNVMLVVGNLSYDNAADD